MRNLEATRCLSLKPVGSLCGAGDGCLCLDCDQPDGTVHVWVVGGRGTLSCISSQKEVTALVLA